MGLKIYSISRKHGEFVLLAFPRFVGINWLPARKPAAGQVRDVTSRGQKSAPGRQACSWSMLSYVNLKALVAGSDFTHVRDLENGRILRGSGRGPARRAERSPAASPLG